MDHRLLHSVAGQHLFVEERGSRQYRMSNILDARIERDFRLRGAEIGVSVAVFNLLGDRTVVD